MASDAAIIARMRAAGVPPHAYSHSLDKPALGASRFGAIIREKRFDLGVGGLVSYIIRNKPKSKVKPSLVAAVAAKELVLLNREVKFVYFAALMTVVRVGELSWLDFGKGYVVVPDLGENTQQWPANEWDYTQAVLLSHVNRGGGLILGDNGVTEGGWFNAGFIDALTIFDEIIVE